MRNIATLVSLLAVMPALSFAQPAKTRGSAIRLDSTTKFELINARVLWVDYRGRRALKLAPLEGHERDTDQEIAAVLTGSDFKDGVIEVDVSGARRQGYSTAEDVSGYKGIVGLTFRMRGDSSERFYVRPENARVNNQLFRNRVTQYESSPDYPWQRLRQENPGHIRIGCRCRVRRMDEAQDRGLRKPGAPVCGTAPVNRVWS